MNNMLTWYGIIIHHSDTADDGQANDWEAIRRYHMSWRINGEIITPDQASMAMAAGKPVIAPWRDIGYHFGIEKVDGRLVRQTGRPLTESGAHCAGKNYTYLGICVVGNFDLAPPDDPTYIMTADLCRLLMRQYNFAASEIRPHNEFANKTCPGMKFDMKYLVSKVLSA